jgi:diguanylate cyclase (GGDEF)-like protein
MTMLIVDIDHFKQSNEQFGYPAGNQYLQQLAEICRMSVRATDLIGRIGKDSFAVLLTETGLSAARLVAERIRKKAGQIRIDSTEGVLSCTVSVGGVALAERHRDMEQLVMECEALLQRHVSQHTDSCTGFA